MQRRDDGHPVAAVLLLFSMFAFAFVFHAVTRQTRPVPAHFDTQLAAFAGVIHADVPTRAESAVGALPVRTMPLIMTAAVEAPRLLPTFDAVDAAPVLEALSWATMPTPLPDTIAPTPVAQSPQDLGAVTRALASTKSTLRNVFKKTF